MEEEEQLPGINVSEKLNLGVSEEFPLDPISSDVAAAKELKEEAEERAQARSTAAGERCRSGSTLMTTLIVSGVVAAAVGIGFMVVKTIKVQKT
ncbi:hypothetical protein HPP92_000016 [Vanilla planifolia]|uniref:Uncharacterized protein n=1 Tax=Vanilla planifolia TaxID=51239 RepID=A0A835VGL4_VANPL|nr:hypothetical protein HPP92_000016 [Vanilla planifolia]